VRFGVTEDGKGKVKMENRESAAAILKALANE
jgi:hypothetical protein